MIIELNVSEEQLVSGGSIVDELNEKYPFGEWDGNKFYPYGKPNDTTPGGGGGIPLPW